MQSGRISLLALIVLSAAATNAFAPNLPVPFFATPVLAQTSVTGEVEAYRLTQQGYQQYKTNQFQSAIESWQQALTLYQQIGNRAGQSIVLVNLGNAHRTLGQYQTAIESYQQSLAIARETQDRAREANSLNHLGEAYRNVGQYITAIELYQQSLAIVREMGQSPNTERYILLQEEIDSLNNLGNAYRNLGQYQKAIAFFEQSLALQPQLGDFSDDNRYALLKEKANSLYNLGNAYFYLGQHQQATQFYHQSLAVAREIGDRVGEANSLGGLGNIYYSLQQHQKAIEFYQQWLAIAREVGNRAGEGLALSNIGNLFTQQNQPELAIIFYKQSVNVRETIRHALQGLPREHQQSYTETVASTYRHLADLLLKQDRVLEAQRVLDLLKVQELEDYLSNVRDSDTTPPGIANRPPEQQIKNGYEAILNQAIEQGKELAQLERIFPANSTEAQQQRVIELRKNQAQITQQFLEFLNSPEVTTLVAQLRQTTGGQGFDLNNNALNLQGDLDRLQADAVILYPFVLDKRLELVLVTPYAPPIRRTVAVKREDLNRAIADFRTALKNPNTDAKTPARQLYNWLIKPIENDLAQAKTKTIIYAPDGQLRYIPLAALYDGNQWLVQRFSINNITALSLTKLNTKSSQGQSLTPLQVFAAAFTQGSYSFQVGDRQFSFRGLKYAGIEVENLAKIVPNTKTVLDRQFNRDSVFQMNDYSIVHLATHAAFVTGQPEDSFILFGDGSRATLRDIALWRLPNVDLMVLSACETGLGDRLGDGKELLGFGYQMQQTGARAAIASLWKVDDGGTQALMDAFYAALENGNTAKANALQEAQIALITGNDTALSQPRGLGIQPHVRSSVPAVVNSRLSHPYYWAPFILIGNGL